MQKSLKQEVTKYCIVSWKIYNRTIILKEGENMKANTYYLFDNGKKIAFSGSFERLLNKTTKTENAEIYYNNVLVWKQNP